MAGGRLVAGVDSSTQSTKVVVVDVDSGAVVASGRADHEVTGAGGARETDPEDWWRALQAALGATGRAPEVGALSVAGQQHGLVILDAAGRPLRPALLWNDTRSAPDAAALVDGLGGPEQWATGLGSVPVASFTVTKWAYLRRTEAHVTRAAAAVRLPHDFLTERLTGEAATDRGDASGTGWWSTRTEAYAAEVLGSPAVELDPAFLPRVLGARQPAGTIGSRVSAALGLPSGTLVGAGTGDNMAAALGLGLAPGEAAMSLGTSGTVFMVSDRRPADASGIVAGFADANGRYLPLACTLNCTLAVDRVASWLRIDREDVAPSGELVALPYFDGERTPDLPSASGMIVGLRHDTPPGSVLMATYEGAAAALLEALDAVAIQAGVPAGEAARVPLTLVGGGAQGRVWRDIVRRLSGRPVVVPHGQELVAMGAAVQAASVLTGSDPVDIARAWRTAEGTILAPLPRDEATVERIGRVQRLAMASGLLDRSSA